MIVARRGRGRAAGCGARGRGEDFAGGGLWGEGVDGGAVGARGGRGRAVVEGGGGAVDEREEVGDGLFQGDGLGVEFFGGAEVLLGAGGWPG